MKKYSLIIFFSFLICSSVLARSTGCKEGNCENGFGKWVYTDKKAIIKKLIDDNFHILDSHYNEQNGCQLNEDQNARYKDFQNKKELEDTELENEISKETEILILNKSK